MTAPLTFDDIVSAAQERTGAPLPNTDTWREGLELLLRDHAYADTLNERGWDRMRTSYVDALSTRMQVDQYLYENPQVAEAPVERPVFILGMPRTGTTMVSYLMHSDPATRSLMRWEPYQAVPPAAPGTLYTDPRALAEIAKDEEILKLHPGSFKAHYEAADGPTECVHLIAQDFKSLMLAVLSTTPTYHDWILFCEMRTAYAHRKRVLQVLQSTNPGRWVLKMPSDSLFIKALFETFPDARVIWTHRDPYTVFGSSMSMRANGRRMFNNDPDIEYMRQRFPMQLGLHAIRPMQMAEQRPDDIYNVYYDDLVADPMATMRQIYSWLGDDFTPEAEAGMQGWLADNPQGRFGEHTYSLGEWGFTKRDLEPYFSDYLRVHPVATGEQS